MTKAPAERSTRSRPRADRSALLALLALVTVAALGLVSSLVFGHKQRFFLDEWEFLLRRDASNVGDLLRPHNEHWSTLPILLYRALLRVFGLRTYVPYQLVLILLHLTAAFLLWAVMRRAGVRPWIATAGASLFVLFGAGYENIVWAFQIGFVASLVLGLAQLLLADHDGPLDRRDWLGLLAGSAALLCSGVAVTMTFAVGLATLARRGWRAALFHTAPLGILYVVWWFFAARDAYTTHGGSIGDIARFVATAFRATFDAMGQLPGIGVALGLLLIVGLGMAWHGLDPVDLRRRAAVPGALLVGSVLFLVITGLGRVSAFGPQFARAPRYLHLIAAFSLPALAVAANAVADRWRMLTPGLLALFLIGIPGNLHELADYTGLSEREPPLLYALRQSEHPAKASACETLGPPVRRHLDKGQSLHIDGGRVRAYVAGELLSLVVFDPAEGHTVTALWPLGFMLTPDATAKPVVVCG